MARLEHESSSSRSRASGAGRKRDRFINASVSRAGKDVNPSETSQVGVTVGCLQPEGLRTLACNASLPAEIGLRSHASCSNKRRRSA